MRKHKERDRYLECPVCESERCVCGGGGAPAGFSAAVVALSLVLLWVLVYYLPQ